MLELREEPAAVNTDGGFPSAIEWEGNPLKVVSPQGLILLKSFRSSGQDQDDIEYLRSLENED